MKNLDERVEIGKIIIEKQLMAEIWDFGSNGNAMFSRLEKDSRKSLSSSKL